MSLYTFAIALKDSFSAKFRASLALAQRDTTTLGASVDTLKEKLKGLERERNINVDAKRVAVLNAEIKRTEAEINKINKLSSGLTLKEKFTEAAQSSSLLNTSLSLVSNPLNAIVLGVTGFGVALNKGIQVAAQISDKLADVRKSTQMSEKEAENFSKTLQGIDTRTSLAGLLDIAKIGGQIGIANKDLVGFTKVMDMASVALSDEFSGGSEEVARQLGTLKSLFKETKNLAPDEALSRVGSAINHIGSISQARGGNMAEFTKRMGQLGTLAPNLIDTLAIGGALETLGVSSEIGASGLANIISTAGEELPSFAKWLNISQKELSNMINTNPTDLLVTFAKSLKNLPNTEIIKVMQSLKIGTDESRKSIMAFAAALEPTEQYSKGLFQTLQSEGQKAYTENQSLANEFAIKNNNLAARLDKAKNSLTNMSLTLGNVFAPAVSFGADMVTKLVGNGETLISVLQGGALGALAGATAYGLYAIATGGLTTALILAKAQQWALNIAMNANPVGLIITSFALLGAGVAYAYENFEGFRGMLWGVWEAIKAVTEKIALFSQGVIAMLSGDWDKAMKLDIQSNAINVADAYTRGEKQSIAAIAKPIETQGLTKVVKKPTTHTPTTSLQTDVKPNLDFLNEEKNKKNKKIADRNSGGSGIRSGVSEVKMGNTGTTNINVNITKLVETLNITSQTLGVGLDRVREEVSKTLLAAVNDVNLIR